MSGADNGIADTSATAGGAERRSRLRQYQVQLLERMQAAKAGGAAASRELGVQSGQRRYLLDLTQVGEIVSCSDVTAVPLVQPWYQGLANIRGNLTGIVDLSSYRGEAPQAAGAESRFVTFAPGLGVHCALLATRVLGLRNLAEMTEQTEQTEQQDAMGTQFVDADGQRWTRLDLALLVREARFLDVGL